MARYNRNIAARLMADLQRDFGLDRTQAAAVVGNLSHESAGFRQLQEKNPIVPGSKGGFGFAQWTGPRRRSFERWSEKQGLDIRSYEANYGFLKHEIATDPYEGGQFRKFVEQSKGKSLDQATQIFSDRFLRPGIPHMKSRKQMAQSVIDLAPQSDPATQIAQSDIPVPGQRPQSFDPGGLLNPSQVPSMSLVNEAQALPVPDPVLRDYAGITSQTPQSGYVDQSPLNPAPVGDVQRASLNPAIRPRDIAKSSPLGILPDEAPTVPMGIALRDMSEMSRNLGPTPEEQINRQAGLLALPSVAPRVPQEQQPPMGLPEPRRVKTTVIRPQEPQPDPIGSINQSGLLSLPNEPPQIAGAPQSNATVRANPESYPSQEAYEQAMAAQGLPVSPMAQPMPKQPVAPFPGVPQGVAAPPAAFPPAPAPMAPATPAAPMGGLGAFPDAPEPYRPPSASGMDVWQGRAMSGIASDGTELNRAANGDVYRYNPTYDHTQRVGPDGAAIGGVMQGRVEGPANNGGGIKVSMPSIGAPFGEPQTRMGGMVRGVVGSAAGGILGSFLGGPLGGLLGSAIGNNLARGQGILGNGGQVVGGRGQREYPNAPSRTNDGMSESQRQANIDRSEQSGRYSSRAIEAARTGRGGLF